MMFLFKKIQERKVAKDAIQSPISGKWKTLKERFATYLQQKSEILSIQTKRYALIFFCLLFGGSSVAVIVHSSTAKEQAASITKISNPVHSIQNENNYLKPDSSITKREYDRVEQFKTYLLQIKKDSFGKNRFDSIMQARPRLIDSIHLFEKLYLQQK